MTPANDFDKVSEAMEFAWQRMGLMYDDGLLYEGRDALESLRAQVTELELERDGLREAADGILQSVRCSNQTVKRQRKDPSYIWLTCLDRETSVRCPECTFLAATAPTDMKE